MSIARISTRAPVFGLGVLASLAFTACPSWAAGNSANAKLCHEYPGALLAQDGSAFKNAGQCTTYGSEGGQIAGVNAVTTPVVGTEFGATFSGFGLKPGTEAIGCGRYSPSGVSACVAEIVHADGTFAAGEPLACDREGSNVAFLFVQATTAGGTFFERRFPPPSGC
jgi:hypothetical protein